ncbi:oxidoreductase, partial [Mycolicibacterium insubricum]|nr:oxidoreductase [Mycolicibacterium insubricum]
MNPDPLAPLAALPGVAEAAEAARDELGRGDRPAPQVRP